MVDMDVRDEYVDLVNRSRTLEPSGDEEHDRLTSEALGLDALHPHRNAVVKADFDEVVADSNEE